MNVELNKIKRTVYLIVILLIVAVAGATWLLTRSLVEITVSPRTASLWVDDREVKVIAGVANINTSIGDHMLRVEAEDYIGQNQLVSFKRGWSKASLSLAEMPRPIQINSAAVHLAKGNDFNEGFYLSGTTIYRTKFNLDENGNINVLENRPVTEPRVTDVKEIIWSPDKALALLRHTSSVTLFDFKKYDFVNQTDSPWGGADIGSIAWSPDNSKIAYYYAPASGERSLIFSNTINSEMLRVANFAELGIENPILHWSPDSEWLMIIPRDKKTEDNKIYLFNTYSRTMKTVNDTGNNIDANFSPDSNKILYSQGGALFLMDKDGENKSDLNLRANLKTVVWLNDSRNIIVAGTDQSTLYAPIFQFDTIRAKESGFAIKNLGNFEVQAIALADDGKILLYETDGQLYALKVN